MKVQNQRTLNYKDEIQKEIFTREKTINIDDNTLLTLYHRIEN